MQRWKWNRKKPPIFPLLVLVLLFFIAFSTLHSEHTIQRIHEIPDHVLNHQEVSSATFVKPNLSGHLKQAPGMAFLFTACFVLHWRLKLCVFSDLLKWGCWILEVLDRFSRCNSTVEYSGKKIAWRGDSWQSGRRRVRPESCDVFSGKWVFDNVSHPLYNESDCPYMSDQLACHKHGRSDLGYQYWRWQPHNCNLKRWNVKEMWEKLRDKRLMFVGDSLNRGQWISMVCLLQSVIPADKRSMSPNAHLTIFRAEDYNATVEFLWAPLLVESNSDDPVNHRLDERIIRPDTVLRHASLWENADILVFNTYLWWRQGPVKLLSVSIHQCTSCFLRKIFLLCSNVSCIFFYCRWTTEENGACEELDGRGAMELAMGAWAEWVSSKVDPLKKRVFFVTMSPTHLW
ncbi:hypothetical protein V8G54_010520 [Vigna mungo]|uniref:Trichome birefringence-like N-terminal domain-containing protein n=1 Tax=Vigna mungo TaxID=3915 RepID=A0AAQ3S5V2_VIGMU